MGPNFLFITAIILCMDFILIFGIIWDKMINELIQILDLYSQDAICKYMQNIEKII